MTTERWETGMVVEMAPNFWVLLTHLDKTDISENWTYVPVAPRWSRWQRIKLWFGWRPVVGY